MPITPNNTDKMKNKPAGERENPLDTEGDVERAKPVRYGRDQEIKFDPNGDVTHPQEYKKDGLPKTDRYAVVKDKKP